MYHAKQRGWLELDLIIGQWAEKNLHSLSSEELKDFEELLGCENPDLFKYLTNQMEAGEDLQHNKAFQVRWSRSCVSAMFMSQILAWITRGSDVYLQMIRKSVESTMEYYGSFSSTRTSKEWVRGWNDGSTNN
jgi:succinate dehydrogenase flavin-adding protein (antitoxin of CptAB toxin-antitoxin module)